MAIDFGGAFRKVAGTLVDLEDKKQPEQIQPASKAVAPTAKMAANQAAVVQTAQYDPSMLEELQKQVLARKTPYTALVEKAAQLEDVIPDATMRLKAAFKMVAVEGQRSISSISQALDVHITDLEGARMRFKQASDAQMKQKSGALRDQAAKLEKTNAAAAQQIESLQSQIASLVESTQKNTEQINELNVQASQAEAEIVATADAFERTVDYVKNDLMEKKVSLTSVLAS